MPYFNQPSGSFCTRAQYGDLGGGIVSVHNQENLPPALNGTFAEICGTAYQADPVNSPAELVVGFPQAEDGRPANYKVLSTDYTSYSAVYNCENFLNDQFQYYGWVLTREANPSEQLIEDVLAIFVENNIPLDDFEVTYHNNCDYDSESVLDCSSIS